MYSSAMQDVCRACSAEVRLWPVGALLRRYFFESKEERCHQIARLEDQRLMRASLRLFFIAIALLTAASFGQAASSHTIRERVVTLADQTQIHLLEAGHSTSAPALVFIPGWTMPAFLWNQQMKRFSNDRLVIAVDPRSQGDSSKTELGNTPEQRAKDLREILSIHIPDAVLIGWSQGVQDVAAYIQQFGTNSLAGLVFVDSPVSAGPFAKDTCNNRRDDANNGRLRARPTARSRQDRQTYASDCVGGIAFAESTGENGCRYTRCSVCYRQRCRPRSLCRRSGRIQCLS